MTLKIQKFVLGPLENNTYLVSDTEAGQCVVIDPSFDITEVNEKIQKDQLILQAVWITHGHFDHFAGLAQLSRAIPQPLEILIHERDYALWQNGGEASLVGCMVDQSVEPNVLLKDFQTIQVGNWTFKALPTPGHTPGHVTYYCPEAAAAFCGDVLFRYSIGRTDLRGGDYFALLNSIQTQILTMPPDTTLYSGHGEDSTVRDQLQNNPFIISHTQRRGSRE